LSKSVAQNLEIKPERLGRRKVEALLSAFLLVVQKFLNAQNFMVITAVFFVRRETKHCVRCYCRRPSGSFCSRFDEHQSCYDTSSIQTIPARSIWRYRCSFCNSISDIPANYADVPIRHHSKTIHIPQRYLHERSQSLLERYIFTL